MTLQPVKISKMYNSPGEIRRKIHLLSSYCKAADFVV